MVPYFTRSEWGAAPPKRDLNPFIPAAVRGVCIHYTGSGSRANISNMAAYLRSIQVHYFNGGNSGEDYPDIAYNVGVDLDGNLYELRGWTVRGGANGTTASNATYPSIFLVMGDADEVTPEMVEAVREAIRRFRAIYPDCLEIHGHREFYGTSCPGPAMAFVQDGSFEPLSAAVESPAPEEEAPMYLVRPEGYWDTYLMGAGEPKHVHDPESVRYLVNAGKITFMGKPVAPGTDYVAVTEAWPVALVRDVAGFDATKGTRQ